jgi:exodeoxyribonuclease-3
VGWRLDYFMVSPDLKERVLAADIYDEVMGSDHCPISLVLDL